MKKYLKLSCLGCGGLIVIVLVIGVIVSMFEDVDDSIGGSVPTASRETPKVSQDARPSETPRPRPTQTPAPAPLIYEFQGSGDSVKGPFTLVPGLVSVVASHSGKRNFIVEMVGPSSTEVSINEIGTYSGARAHAVASNNIVGLSPGSHRLQVKADGRWTATVKQSFPTAGKPPPITHQGSGDNVVSWLLLREGQFVFSASHTGQRNFIVELVNSSGEPNFFLVNEIGNYQGSQIIQVESSTFGFNPVPGLYALVVKADGRWDFTLEP